jgi:sigma-B regulation protein RsbU (phosphoserine phosphatase)
MILVGTPLQIAWPLWALASIGVAHGLSFLGIAGHSLELLAVFPNPSRLGRWALRWKWAILLPFGLVALCTAISQLQTLYGWTGAIPDLAAAIDRLVPPRILILCLALMPLSLLLAQRLETRGRPQARQRVIEAGFTLAIAGTLCSVIFPMSVAWRVFLPRGAGVAVVASLLALLIPLVLTYCLPLSMAYAVLAQRVFGFRSLVRRSVQHLLLSRGVLAVEGLALFVVLEEILRHAQRSAGSPGPLVAAVAAAGSLLTVGVMTRVNRPLMQRIDRRFFRESYDARRVLLGLAQRMTSLRERDEILRQAGGAILGALHPARVGFLLLPDAVGAPPPAREPAPSAAATEPGAGRQGSAQPIVLADPLLAEPTRALEPGRDWIELPPSLPWPGEEPPPAPYELLVALPGSAGLLGSMALAAKLSEEPFSGEDRELLVTVATQMGLALENAALLEIARREAQQARDLEIARQVQQSLYPSDLPRAAGWEFTAASLPARAVGGDYFDLFEIAPGFLAVALGDVSGKGLGASLLMARTHAMIRGGMPRGMGNLATLMEELNESLVASTPMTMYVTLFVGILETASGRLRYVNCGHLPPMLVGTGETLPARLEEGGTVLGMLEGSSYREGEARLEPGALLVLFSDGITEATGGAGEMFGESGLREALSRSRDLAACDIAPKVLEAVREFVGGGEQSDDISLLIVRRKP